MGSMAASTLRCYNSSIETYFMFCKTQGLKSFMVNTANKNWNIFSHHWGRGDGCRLVISSVEKFLAHSADQKKAFGSIEGYIAALRSYCKDIGHEEDLNNNRFRKLIEGIHKSLGDKKSLKRQPFTPDMLNKMEYHVNQILDHQTPRYYNLSTRYNCYLIMACVTFALGGAFRGSEFLLCTGHLETQPEDSRLKLQQIEFHNENGIQLDSQTFLVNPELVKSLHVKLTRSKTDLYKKGSTVIITHDRVISWLIKYIRVRPTFGSPMLFLNSDGAPFQINQFTFLVRQHLEAVGFTPEEVAPIMGHSFRMGAAQILRDANVSSHQMMEFGRWQSDTHNVYHRSSIKEKQELDNIVMKSN